MQRPTWEGHLRLSLVTCPVALYPLTTNAHDVRFHLLNPKTGNRVRQQWQDPEAGKVERSALVRGYEVERDHYVILTDEELHAVRLESTRTIDIERFVDASSIDRIWWNDPYALIPAEKAGYEAFNVIRTAMADSAKVALARVVIGTRERLLALEPRDSGLLATTLRSADEVRDLKPLFDPIPAGRPPAAMLKIADAIIEQQSGPFDPSEFNDRYEDALRALIASKQTDGGDGGGRPAATPRKDNVVDLMEALRRSLEGSAPAPRKAAARKTAAAKTKPPPAKAAPAKAKPTRRRAG